jgi:hypothetical protein
MRHIRLLSFNGAFFTDETYPLKESLMFSLCHCSPQFPAVKPVVIRLYSLDYPIIVIAICRFGDLLWDYCAAKVRLRLALSSPSLR